VDLIDKWEQTGLLINLTYDNKLKVSQLYESMANYAIKIYPSNWKLDREILINNFYYKKTTIETVEGIMFPTIYRIVNSGGNIYRVANLYEDLIEFVDSINFKTWDYRHLDTHNELIVSYVEMYRERILNKDYKFKRLLIEKNLL
tara:strand:- start:1064 stop:1498 length:435 start_codon:yes stop_codon:yes gene_type:complete